ncbi:NHL domain-containing thioredoxin family protein [Streptomyces iconiensis]|uniref:NHL domain-containing thioredoxin family protein n=1 Tax=Streptomyces iconiensis TaxID=1384038 RepID=A0ABT6ZS11_9ACTN|nr:NHL domain-containing thioredoxin family protein [Streptomyces iconiensis]MDJ1131574.1 NHL domain-containing thioredoxin family protein [Streptomyces iconiensis]
MNRSAASSRRARVRAPELTGAGGWLNTGGESLDLAALRGKCVIVDFWTFCCVNCLHVLDELRELEEQHQDTTVVVGVHSPKFVHEAEHSAVVDAVERYGVAHPVLDDPDLATWKQYAVRAWPTLVVIDPEGYVVAQHAGEGHVHAIEKLITELEAEHEAKGTLRRGGSLGASPAAGGTQPEPAATDLRFPGKALALPGGGYLVSDTTRHQLVELAADGETAVRRIGTGERGLTDGTPEEAAFNEPQGLTFLPDGDILIADTVNHALRRLDPDSGTVVTVAGTGAQWWQGAPTEGPAREVSLSSPWDVAWFAGRVWIAMAGVHQLWTYDPEDGTVRVAAGTTNEGLADGPAAEAWFAQPSGLATTPDGTRLWVADSETSALRYVEPAGASGDGASAEPRGAQATPETGRGLTGPESEGLEGQVTDPEDEATHVKGEVRDPEGGFTVRTAVGTGLFDFGHRDGPAEQALFQHPLGVTALPDGSVAVSDTYNHALRRYDPATGEVTTLATDLREPSGAVLAPDGTGEIVVVESARHRLTRLRLPEDAVRVEAVAHRTQRAATEVAAGALRLDVVFQAPPGQKLDTRYGPSTRLIVSSTPPGLLAEGEGQGTELSRELLLTGDEGTEGVLHVSAMAASCDEEGEYPACHMHQQDWGVPVRLTATGADRLPLVLAGMDEG